MVVIILLTYNYTNNIIKKNKKMINLKHKGDLIIDGNIELTGGTITIDGLPIGGGNEWTGGTQYIIVKADGTDIENAAELQAAYTLATTMSPSATTKITIVATPGNYNFGTSAFIMGTQYIDLVSLDGNRSVIFNSSNEGGTISITSNYVFVKGINTLDKPFKISGGLTNIIIENCKGGNFSFGGGDGSVSPVTINGSFINCEGGSGSFGSSNNIGFSTFINCVATDSASFGNGSTINEATFIDCISGSQSFGAFGTITNANFTRCIGGLGSFTEGSTVGSNAIYISCRLSSGTFSNLGVGKFILCINDDYTVTTNT